MKGMEGTYELKKNIWKEISGYGLVTPSLSSFELSLAVLQVTRCSDVST